MSSNIYTEGKYRLTQYCEGNGIEQTKHPE